jgi:hypothetical protein
MSGLTVGERSAGSADVTLASHTREFSIARQAQLGTVFRHAIARWMTCGIRNHQINDLQRLHQMAPW